MRQPKHEPGFACVGDLRRHLVDDRLRALACSMIEGLAQTFARLLRSAGDGIDFGNFKSAGDQLPQPFLDSRHELWIAPPYGDCASRHFRKIFRRNRQPRNPARIDMERGLLTQINRPCLTYEEVLAGASRALIIGLRSGVEDYCEAYVTHPTRRSTQDNVW